MLQSFGGLKHVASPSLPGAGPAPALLPCAPSWAVTHRSPLQQPAAIPAEGAAPPLLSEQAEALPRRQRWSVAGFHGAAVFSAPFGKVLGAPGETLRGTPSPSGVGCVLWFDQNRDHPIFLSSKNLEGADDFSSDKFQ